MLTSAPVLQLPDLDKPFVVVCDASNVSLGACLMQDGHPIAFESAKLKPNELNYHAGEKELLAVVHALRLWRCYLSDAQQFTVVTDHNPNTTFDTKTTLSDRQARLNCSHGSILCGNTSWAARTWQIHCRGGRMATPHRAS